MEIELLGDAGDVYVVVDGRKVAKREHGRRIWIILEPGWRVTTNTDTASVEVAYAPPWAH